MQDKISYDYVASTPTLATFGNVDVKQRRRRIYIIVLLAFLWSTALVYRLASLQLIGPDFWRNWGAKQHFSEIKVASERGPVYDRNGRPLAVSVPAGSVFIRPREVRDKEAVLLALTDVLDIHPNQIRKAFDSKQPFVWLKRQIPLSQAEYISGLHLAGVGHLVEARRYYPYNQAGSALIGRVGIDGNGLSGLEARYDKLLSGDFLRAKVGRDAHGHKFQELTGGLENFELPKGSDLYLTIDADMQYILDDELELGRRKAHATAALGALVDTETGEILALGQAPSYNFNQDKVNARNALMNRTIETVFEPGSIMKPIVTAAALESGVVHPMDIVDCESGAYRFGGHTIKDTHRVGAVTVQDVVVHSSNIGMTKIGIKLGRDRLYDSLVNFGFGQPIGLNLPGETRGILRRKENWSTVDIATHSFGQGVAVTPLQMLRALSSVVNGGILPHLHVIRGEQTGGMRVISEQTASEVRDMMFAVVEDAHGTGKRAAIEGVRIGGKTGTAQKARKGGRGYASGLYMASFMGFADATSINLNEKLALIIVIDEPHQGSIYGGTVAAPVFKSTMARVLHLLSTRKRLSAGVDKIESFEPQNRYGVVQASYKG